MGIPIDLFQGLNAGVLYFDSECWMQSGALERVLYWIKQNQQQRIFYRGILGCEKENEKRKHFLYFLKGLYLSILFRKRKFSNAPLLFVLSFYPSSSPKKWSRKISQALALSCFSFQVFFFFLLCFLWFP